jgi:hypothetical protein
MRDTLFSFEVHFGGIFVRIPNLVYEGGGGGGTLILLLTMIKTV